MTAHAAHAMHANSVEAFAALNVSQREALVLSAYALARAPMTDRECAARLGFDHKSAVQPRISTLIADGYLWECGSIRDETTGRKVRVCIPTSLATRRTGLPT